MKKVFISSFIFTIFLHSLVHSQNNSQSYSPDRAAQYYLGTSNELLIPINIWGYVQKPGQYMVPDNTDLVALLSFAGGPTENAKLNFIRIIRNDPKIGNVVYKIDVKRYIETADDRLIPNLRPGDTVIVNGTAFHWVSQFFDFVARLSTFVQIYYLIAIAQSYNK
jgi:polysaccharide export outer membrane protein